jgi:hypothetical protein
VKDKGVCANANDEVNEVQEVGYGNLWAGGEWPRCMCDDEAGLGSVRPVRWPAARKVRKLAAAR